MQRELKYFIAHFGEKYAHQHPVRGGCYPVPSWLEAAQIISEGDLMLLSCWRGHEGLCGGAAWGLGKVTHKEHREEETAICYEPKPLSKPVERAKILDCLPHNEKGKFMLGATRKAFWLREIPPASFQCIVR